MWAVHDNSTTHPDDYFLPKKLQMVKLEIMNSKTMTQETMLGTWIGFNPLRDPCSGDSGEIFP